LKVIFFVFSVVAKARNVMRARATADILLTVYKEGFEEYRENAREKL